MNRRPIKSEAERISFAYDHGALTANTTVKLFKAPAGRKFRVDRALYINVTGLAEDTANNFAIQLKNGATVVANIANTDSDLDPDVGASIAANTFVEGVPTSTNVLAAADELSLVFTETGTATLPAGRIYIEGRLL